MSSSFGDLLQQAEQLTADMDTGWELPRVERNLHQLAEAGQRLWAQTTGTVGDNAAVKASILLGTKGFDVPHLSEKLDRLNTTKTFEPLEPVRETDIQGFLRNERENAILSAIEEARKNTFNQAEKHQWSCMENEWEKEKEKILNSLLGAGQESIDFSAESEVFTSSSLNMQGRSALDATELAYARQLGNWCQERLVRALCKYEAQQGGFHGDPVNRMQPCQQPPTSIATLKELQWKCLPNTALTTWVYIHNEALIQSQRHSIVNGFLELSDRFDDPIIKDMWMFVRELGEEAQSTSSSSQTMAAEKCDGHPDAPVWGFMAGLLGLLAMGMFYCVVGFIEKARNFLERRYLKFVQDTVYDNLHEAKLGGVPGTFNLVKSYLKIKLPPVVQGLDDGDVDGAPLWALIYFCLRCGDPRAALEAVKHIPQHLVEFEDLFTEYMNSKEGSRLSPNSESKLRLQYRRSIRTSQDPFKRAVYCLIGRCDVQSNHQEVANKTEDYLWLKLSQVTVHEEDGVQDSLTFQRLQIMLLEQFGEAHFGAHQKPLLYFQVLFLTGQFEAAIEFLSRVDTLRSHAVHFAIALYKMHLLLLPESIQAQLLTKEMGFPAPGRQLNFARLIMTYTRKFEVTDPREALQYFFLLKGMRTPHGEDLFMSCISELVLETREFELLLGRVERDGTRKPGCIDKFHRDTQRIIELVAKDSAEKGLSEEAVKLFDLAKNHEKALEILNKLLSQVISASSGLQSPRDRLHAMAFDLAQRVFEFSTDQHYHLTLKMASAQVVETSVTNNSPSQDSYHPDDLFQSRYRALGHNASQSRINTFFVLLDLMQFFNLYHAGELDTALDVMRKLKLIPLKNDMVEERVASFRQYNDEIRRNFPDVLLATMNILYKNYRKTRGSGLSPLVESQRDDGGQEKYREILRHQARALITFAGLIPYRLPGDTNARLVQLEVLMN
ncbi:Nuclear pore complex protein Nup93 [Acropora cervicornis]|uniref:Nuclear pore protein n=1 Tax=Acropora cervicornis TaxID=6130 RepID=A0AAD9V4D9_ACRCE|nr:Nuclear pore complex protein Nup93 [Acropora cervicornis]